MSLRIASLLLAVALVFAGMRLYALQQSQPESSMSQRVHPPVNVILDTDMWSDIDDAMALAMLHALQDRGEINLVAVSISTNERWPATYVSLLDTFYQHPQIPIGVVAEGGPNAATFRKRFPEVTWPITRYTERLSEQTNADGTLVYPRLLSDTSTAPEASTLLRKTLAAQPDGSVVVIQIGYSTNLARLLATSADSISPLDGRQLIAKKVRFLSIMAGNFGDSEFEGSPLPKGSPEFNLMIDVPAARTLFERWPTPIVASGFEVGAALQYPPESIEHDFAYVRNHPIVETYLTFCEEQKALHQWTCPHAHNTYDLTAVLYAARPDRNYFSVSNPGRISVQNDGGSQFEEAAAGRDRFLILRDDQKSRVTEAMVMLVSQPPGRTSGP